MTEICEVPRLAAELHAQFSSLIPPLGEAGESACTSATVEQAIKANLRGAGMVSDPGVTAYLPPFLGQVVKISSSDPALTLLLTPR